MHFNTKALHSGYSSQDHQKCLSPPIYQTTSYVFDNTEHAKRLFSLQDFGFIYSRLTNPTVSVLEERLASIEQSRAAVACSSGHAAQQLAFIPLLKNGDAGKILTKLHDERKDLYKEVSDHIIITEDKSSQEVANEIIKVIKS